MKNLLLFGMFLLSSSSIASERLTLAENISPFEEAVRCKTLIVDGEKVDEGSLFLKEEESGQIIAEVAYLGSMYVYLMNKHINGRLFEKVHLSTNSIYIDNNTLHSYTETEGSVQIDEDIEQLYSHLGVDLRSESIFKIKKISKNFEISILKIRSQDQNKEVRSFYCSGKLDGWLMNWFKRLAEIF